MPRLSRLGRIWAMAALVLLFWAIAVRAEGVLLVCAVATLVLVADLLLTLPLGRRARAAGLELSWRVREGEKGRHIVRGTPIRIEGTILMRHPAALRLVGLRPIAPDGIKVESVTESVDLGAQEPSPIELTLRAKAAGRCVLQGLATRALSPLGVFEVGLYFPHPVELRVSPRALKSAPEYARTRRRSAPPVPRDGSSSARERGPGVELYELREYRPGDPLRSIASVASARRGQLLVRETERPYEEEHLILLDLGAEMHAGAPGARSLDLAVDAIWTLIGELSERSHRIRLAFFDDTLLGEWTSDGGVARGRSLRQALLNAFERYDRTRIEGDEEEVAALVAEHLRDQEASFYGVSTAGDRARLASALRPRVRGVLRDPMTADSFEVLLAYCRRYGLELPPRSLVPRGAREAALRAILLSAARTSRLHTVHLFSDLDGIALEGELTRVLSLDALRGKLTLYTPRPSPLKDEAPFPAALRRTIELEHEQTIRATSALFRRHIIHA